MNLKKIQDADVEDKKVFLRVGFDVGIENGRAKETYKIKSAKESLDYLLSKNAKIALVTYLGRPGGKIDLEFSLSQLVTDIEEIFGVKVKFVSDCIGEEVKKTVENLKGGEVALLENVRFYPGEGGIAKGDYDPEFAEKLAAGFDLFVNETFSQSHRDQASVTGVTKFLPSYAGFWLQKEIENLDKVKNNPKHPAVAIIGGAKIETKLPVISKLAENYDHVLVGGKIANEAKDQNIGFSEKVILPVDFTGDRLDIGPETIKKFKEIIASAKTIVWNGPMGKFEETPYDTGTREILNAVLESDAFSVVGGGESVEVIEENNAMDKISFVSTGGGAMLEYMSGKELPGLVVLKA
jgi:phosphoglycerate kinase